MNSLLNAFNNLESKLRLHLLSNYFSKNNSSSDLFITNVELTMQSDNGIIKNFATVTKRNCNFTGISCDIKEDVDLNLVIEDLLLNYSDFLLDQYLSKYTSDIKSLENGVDSINLLNSKIKEFKNRFNKDNFKKYNIIMKDTKQEIISQLSKLNFKKIILNSDALLDDFDNYALFLDDGDLKYIKQLIQLIDRWSSEGFLYYSFPNDSYNGMFFNTNDRMIWQTSMSTYCEEINLLLKEFLKDIRSPTKLLYHNTQPFTGYMIHFDDLKNWLLVKNN